MGGSFRADRQPLKSIHFGEKLPSDSPTGNIFYVYGFSLVAVFVVLVAGINFTNLSIVRITRKAKVVGLEKVPGEYFFCIRLTRPQAIVEVGQWD